MYPSIFEVSSDIGMQAVVLVAQTRPYLITLIEAHDDGTFVASWSIQGRHGDLVSSQVLSQATW